MKLLYLLLALSFSQSYPQGPHRSLRIPLHKLEKTLEERKALIKFLSSRYRHKYLSFLSSDPLPLDNYWNCEYVGSVGVGTPPQFLDVIFDTGSGNFFINSNLCTSDTCKTRKFYNHDYSSTFKDHKMSLSVTYGTGDVKGRICADTVSIAGVELQNQHLAEVTEENGSVFVGSKFSGLLGLGFNPLAAKGTVPIFDSIVKSQSLDWNVFSFFFSLDPLEESELMLGDVNPDRFTGEIHWIPLTEDPVYWTVIIQDVRLGEKSLGVCKEGCKAAVDTGTSLISAPSDALDQIHKHFDKSCDDIYSYPDLIFVIDGKEYPMPPKNYIITSRNNRDDDPGVHSLDYEDCEIAFIELNLKKPMWILGDLFLSSYYSVFDRDRMSVGLAKAKY